ncbi:MAG: thiol peroxidase [Candidatus Hydrogenedentales bacterium]
MPRKVTMRGNPVKVEGNEVKVGDNAPDATLRKNLATDFKLSETQGKKRIYSCVPSLDTPVCADQTRRFNKELGNLPPIDIYTISCDLPVAQARFCNAEGLDKERMHTLSDHKELQFGKAYGTLLPDLRILCRAVFIVDEHDKLRYVEYVPEIAEQPNFDAILAAVKEL